MKNVLYVGNNLQQSKSNVSSIHVLGSRLEAFGFKLWYTSSKRHKWLRLLDMCWCVLVKRRWVDVVLIDTYSTINFYYALAVSQLCRLLHLPYIPILHGGNLEKRLQRNPKLSRCVFGPAHTLVSPSLFMKDTFESHGYPSVYIPNSIEISKYPFQQPSFESIRLLWVRSFSEIYHPSLAVQILKGLQDLGYDASLTMVGPESDGSFKKVQDLAKEMDVIVTFTGKLSKTDWHQLSKSHNFFINTTHFDNMPVSVIEAMALGLPVVSTRVGGMPYLVSHKKDGWLVPPNDTKAFVETLIYLFEHPEVASSIALEARKKVEGFDWEVVKGQWVGLLK
ncbi:glycosyltransferase family 4 protein [Mangrovimonas futianensis]|uniref:glycosyltransferase family 4 protein n=1 Tax=Mangrovimonas futianensis TaxID=2895523 RepID=UPI001E336414|nr:glycosyltransferase family 4 protein [Mangrovimonas futianensis]MCF1421417.1 glycosyltransferase family 4 protein [Mangrovimonas futianensis]